MHVYVCVFVWVLLLLLNQKLLRTKHTQEMTNVDKQNNNIIIADGIVTLQDLDAGRVYMDISYFDDDDNGNIENIKGRAVLYFHPIANYWRKSYVCSVDGHRNTFSVQPTTTTTQTQTPLTLCYANVMFVSPTKFITLATELELLLHQQVNFNVSNILMECPSAPKFGGCSDIDWLI